VEKKWQQGRQEETRQPCDSPQTCLRVACGGGRGGGAPCKLNSRDTSGLVTRWHCCALNSTVP
jgi:hypothetical protein